MLIATHPVGEVLRSQLLAGLPQIDHYSSCRTCSHPDEGVWMPRQVHSATVVVLDEALLRATAAGGAASAIGAQPLPEADAVITRLAGQWIGVRTADCVPVLLADVRQRVIAAVHAGWRGTVAHITALTVRRMVDVMGCHPADLHAAIGPSIGPDAFEVGEEVAEAFVAAGRADCVRRAVWGPSGRQPLVKPHIDLWQSNVMDLLDEGLQLEHIDCTPWCTLTHRDRFFSARCEGIGTGRIVSAICLQG